MAFRSLLMLTGSGMVLFEKEWVKPAATEEGQASDYNRWGALLRTLAEFSLQATGYPVSFMEFPTLAITITADPKTKLLCAIFHDTDVRPTNQIRDYGNNLFLYFVFTGALPSGPRACQVGYF